MDDDKNDSVTFKVHKQVYYLNLMQDNQVVVNGRIINKDAENETGLEISFNRHFLTSVYLSFYWGLGLLAIILGLISSATMYIYLIGGILLAIGIALWIHVRKNSERDIQQYKTLISEILQP